MGDIRLVGSILGVMKKIFIVLGGLILLTVITLFVIGKQEDWATQSLVVKASIQSGVPSVVAKNTLGTPTVALSDFQSANCISKSESDAYKRIKVGVNETVKICIAPQILIDQTNKYIISTLGEEYFSRNINLIPSDTEQLLNRKDGNIYWSLVYADSRFMKELEQHMPIRFSFLIEDINHEVVNGRILPDCVHNESFCAIKVTEENALAIAKTAGLDSNDTAKFEYHIDLANKTGDGWAWYSTQIIPREKGKTCGASKTLETNISTGKTSDIAVERWDCMQVHSF